MTNIRPQQTPRNDDHAARADRRAGKPSQGAPVPGAVADFSGMLAASQRKLEAERLATISGNVADSRSHKGSEMFRDGDSDRDETVAGSTQGAARGPDDSSHGQAQATGTAGASPHSSQMRAESEDSPDLLHLVSLMPDSVDDGLFEVFLPNRAKIGVAVSDMPDGLSYILMTDDSALSDRLRSNGMELEALLKRRIRRNVKVVVV